MPNRVVSSCGWVCVEEVLRIPRPEGFIELKENLGVGAHAEFLNRSAFPVRQLRAECQVAVLENAERESADSVGCLHTASVLLLDCHTVISVSDVRDDGVQVETGIVLLQES